MQGFSQMNDWKWETKQYRSNKSVAWEKNSQLTAAVGLLLKVSQHFSQVDTTADLEWIVLMWVYPNLKCIITYFQHFVGYCGKFYKLKCTVY